MSDTVHRPPTLTERFRRAAHASPAAPALSDETARYTYRELQGVADRMALGLHACGVRRGHTVAIRMPTSARTVAVMLGVFALGAAYVPLDPRTPPSRTGFVLSDSGTRVLVGELDPETPGSEHVTIVSPADLVDVGAPPEDHDEPRPDPEPDDFAYVIYTSGTTGNPKGVPIRHRHVGALLDAGAQRFDFRPEDRWLLFHSISFDFSVWEMWNAFNTGAEVVVPPQWATKLPDRYLDVVIDREISVLNQTPTAFTHFAEAALRRGDPLPALRYVIFGGEKLLRDAVRPWAARFGLSRPLLVNGYGITETTVFTTFHTIDPSDLASPDSVIGEPLAGFAARVVGDDGEDVVRGEVGELWLAGPQVADGYLGRPELTADKFPLLTDHTSGQERQFYRSGDLVRHDPERDELIFEGRADLQVKLRGYRIELSDVEAAVRTHEAIADAAVLVHDVGPDDQRLVCAYAVRDGFPPLEQADLRKHVHTILPSYMRPARYQQLDAMPTTVNGKIDRSAISQMIEERKVGT